MTMTLTRCGVLLLAPIFPLLADGSTDAYFSNLRISSTHPHRASMSMGHPSPLPHTDADSTRTVVPLDGTSGLTLLGTHARAVTYRGDDDHEL